MIPNINRKAEKDKTEIRKIMYDKVAKCDSVFVEEAEIRKLLPGYLDLSKREDVWPVDFQNEVRAEEDSDKPLRSVGDKVLEKRGVLPPRAHRRRPWLGLGKRPPYLLWNKLGGDV